MIIEIALGIILAVVLLPLLPVALFLVAIAAVVAAVIGAIVVVWYYPLLLIPVVVVIGLGGLLNGIDQGNRRTNRNLTRLPLDKHLDELRKKHGDLRHW
jgi:hypothetical protein